MASNWIGSGAICHINSNVYAIMTNIQSKERFSLECPRVQYLGHCSLSFIPMIVQIHWNQSCNCVLFADDTTIYQSHHNINILRKLVEEELSNLISWFKANTLSLNVSKTNVIIFSKTVPINYRDLVLNVDGIIIKPVKSIKFLGINIDNKLNWRDHTHFVQKTNCQVDFIYLTVPNIYLQVNILNRYIIPFYILI